MFTLPAVVILLSGIFNRVSHASAVRRQDAFLQQYETQATQLLEKVSRGIQCHKRLHECDASHDAVSLHLRDARNTAQQPNFPVDKLHDQKLPDVLDTRETQQGEYTENLHTQLKQLSETAAASKAYQAGIAAATKVAEELKKQAKDRQIDVSNEVAGATEALDEAVTTASSTLQQVSNTPLQQVAVSQLTQLRTAVTTATNKLLSASERVDGMAAQLANVPEAEAAEAQAIAQTHNAAFDQANTTLSEVVDGYTALRDSIISQI
ncbi:hypothetical protein MAC_02456 [Metarhizium acridum CQMa 102]|uniref:Cell wall protein n=1 Tax=Metarhizium acridum (strain CQMa 102) TaxID=655827 RepID=E9DXV8_METAQ|nr:uncharacterized protein MAC_02456 [Metarhizium acridum CQMa 102]EFY91571.1 hypothetical protein MAC_02456 [Metarhizium acridum CQMa 102]